MSEKITAAKFADLAWSRVMLAAERQWDLALRVVELPLAPSLLPLEAAVFDREREHGHFKGVTREH